MKRSSWALATVVCVLLWPSDAHAYIGPGAGMAFATAAFAMIASVLVVLAGLLVYPLRLVWRLIRRRRPPRRPRIKRAIVIGLDGLDPQRVRDYMARGLMPNLQQLAKRGCFQDLATTNPPMSPVAWSSFATGVLPGKHGIFDFLTRDPRTYQPDLSSAEVRPARRHLDLGPYRIPLGRPAVKLLRKSRPFWEDLGRHGVPCSILRVPITFPPDRFEGTMLSAMCVPDLDGTQGTFTHYTTRPVASDDRIEGGRRVELRPVADRIDTWIEGPPNPLRRDGKRPRIALRLDIDRASGVVHARVDRKKVELRLGEFSPWISLQFPLGLGVRLRGICRLRLLEIGEHVRLYQTPIQIDPESPVLPISHPPIFATFLSKLCGRFATLGLAEDTWALNEGVLDEDAFLEQAWANHAEREAQLFAMLRRTRRGLVACVFDGSDRIQHMFTRFLDHGHPAAAHLDEADRERFGTVIEDMYIRMDQLVGRVLAKVDPADPSNFVAVISDHGFQTFRRGVNLNAWLREQGYLVLKDGARASEWFGGVDWSKTRAYALGLGGIFLNIAGREGQGIVAPEDAPALADEIAARLATLVDPAGDEPAVRKCYPAHLVRGPYADQSPDVIVGYHVGWRISWDGARGIAAGDVFSDNTKAWSGDHCIDPELVPGVLIANRPLDVRAPHIVDIAPTVLDMFGIPPPRHMDGASLESA
ncbi:MAG: alkaline phosphatase family protein [Kofleriaceae bacterium]